MGKNQKFKTRKLHLDNLEYFQLCDVIPYPTQLAVWANILAIPAFLLMGPVPFLEEFITISLEFEFVVLSVFGIGFPFIMVSTFGRALQAITDLGYVADTNTSVLLTGL